VELSLAEVREALAAREAGAVLLSFDRRTVPTYELCGAETRLLTP
jgi:hypothetical protein